jgi:hypothetical protein
MTDSATPIEHPLPKGAAPDHIDVNWTRRSLAAFVLVLYLEKYLFWAGLASTFYVVAVSQWVAPALQLSLPIVLCLCLLGIIAKFSLIALSSSKKARELWGEVEPFRLSMALTWTGDRIQLVSQDGRVVLNSASFSDVRETPLAFLLLLSAGSFYLIPKRVFSDKSRLAEFRESARHSFVRNP